MTAKRFLKPTEAKDHGVSAFPADCTADPQQAPETDLHSETIRPSVATSELGNHVTAPPESCQLFSQNMPTGLPQLC